MADNQEPNDEERGALTDIGIGVAANLGTDGVKLVIKQVVESLKPKE